MCSSDLELAELKETQTGLRAQWEKEKSGIDEVSRVKKELEATREAIAKAEREYDLNRAAELKYGRLTELEKKLAELSAADDGSHRLLREEVGPDDIAAIISRWTGIPVAKLVEGEREKLLKLGDILHERVIGQDEAVQAVANAVLRARTKHRRSEERRVGKECRSRWSPYH